MPKYPNAHLVLNSRDRTLQGNSGVYNNFNLRNEGQNIVQGAMKDVALSEVYFPYDIPNIQEGYNNFTLSFGTYGTDASGNPTFDVSGSIDVDIPPGFYSAEELREAVEDAIFAAGIDIPGGPFITSNMPTVTYDPAENLYSLQNPAAGTLNWRITSPYTYPLPNLVPIPGNTTRYYLKSSIPANPVGKDIFSIMGFQQQVLKNTVAPFFPQYVVSPAYLQGGGGPLTGILSGSAPLVFTDYIDICSPSLCQYQYLRDGSTTNLPRRVDLICRLYIANETSTGFEEPPGTRPFVIHRQFKNQRVMKNTAANAINDVNIQLYDDCGQPLTTFWTPRNFQITFHVYEADDSEANSNIGYKY